MLCGTVTSKGSWPLVRNGQWLCTLSVCSPRELGPRVGYVGLLLIAFMAALRFSRARVATRFAHLNSSGGSARGEAIGRGKQACRGASVEKRVLGGTAPRKQQQQAQMCGFRRKLTNRDLLSHTTKQMRDVRAVWESFSGHVRDCVWRLPGRGWRGTLGG